MVSFNSIERVKSHCWTMHCTYRVFLYSVTVFVTGVIVFDKTFVLVLAYFGCF